MLKSEWGIYKFAKHQYSLEKIQTDYDSDVVCLFAQSWLTLCDLWAVAHQGPLSLGFFMQEYWSGLLSSPPGDLPDPGVEHMSPVLPALQADSLPAKPSGKPWPQE